MKKLNKKGLSIIELILTFSLVMIISTGILTIIMNYRQRAQIELKKLELVTYKNSLTKDIQTDILDRGLFEINNGGLCTGNNEYSSCINLVFKDGIEKILAVSKLDDNNETTLKKLLNNKYIKYGDLKYEIEDKLPKNIPSGRSSKDFQNIYISNSNILSINSVILKSGEITKIYSIDIYIEHIDYDEDFGIHIVATDNDTLSANMITQEFTYEEQEQSQLGYIEYTIPANGTYKLELWGASGGDINDYTGGLGSYVGGYTYFTKGTILYLYIGGAGTHGSITGGYNGGGDLSSGSETYGSPGGGATDIRTVVGDWNNFDSLKSRIIVAAGGGGANNRNITSSTDLILYGSGNGGAGGGLTGNTGESTNYKATTGYTSYNNYSYGSGGLQNQGGTTYIFNASDTQISSSITGGFGKTNYGIAVNNGSIQSGAGGGWFTGASARNGGAGGGSSYISGHDGCLGISQTSTEANIQMKTNSYHDTYIFNNTTMIDGEGYRWTNIKEEQVSMPTYTGKTGEIGNKGNGHIKITYLGL